MWGGNPNLCGPFSPIGSKNETCSFFSARFAFPPNVFPASDFFVRPEHQFFVCCQEDCVPPILNSARPPPAPIPNIPRPPDNNTDLRARRIFRPDIFARRRFFCSLRIRICYQPRKSLRAPKTDFCASSKYSYRRMLPGIKGGGRRLARGHLAPTAVTPRGLFCAIPMH